MALNDKIGLGESVASLPMVITTLGTAEVVYYKKIPTTTGISSASLSITLAKNTLVHELNVVVRAAPATQTRVETVAQVRTYSTNVETMVIDFGVPRTVSAITTPDGVTVEAYAAWTGAAFPTPKTIPSPSSHTVLSEVRAERLQLTLSSKVTDLQEMFLELPDAPTDLEIRINDGPPVWTHPGPVQPGDAEARSETDWNEDSERIVPLAEAVGALLGDPLSTAPVTFEIKLTTKVPGILEITEATGDHARKVSYINRMLFDGDPAKVLDFSEEGLVDIPLPLPDTPPGAAHVEEIRFTALGNLPPERALPPVGPAAGGNEVLEVIAELVLDPQHAACVRLSGGSGLVQLASVRLPLKAEGDGAEASVVLWDNKAGGVRPLEPLGNGASKPVTLTAGGTEAWTRFDFPKPVPLDEDNPPWLAVLVSRGTVTWALAARPASPPAGSDDALVADNVLRRGAPTGPWVELPAPFLPPAALLLPAGRVRMIGTGDKTTPIAPLVVRVLTAKADVTPTVKGAAVTIPCDAPAPGRRPSLVVTSRTAGTTTLRDIDVVWRT